MNSGSLCQATTAAGRGERRERAEAALRRVGQGWPTVVPSWVIAGGITATLTIGGVAGLYPAIRAARVAPTEALATA